MSTETEAVITNEDIVFECAACGKSMAIDKRGAGLTLEEITPLRDVVSRPELHLDRTRDLQEILDDAVEPIDLSLDDLHMLLQFVGEFVMPTHVVHARADAAQRIANLVRHAAGEATYGGSPPPSPSRRSDR